MIEDRADFVADLTAAEIGADLVEEDLHLAEAEVLIGVEIGATGLCLRLFAATAAKNVKFLLGPQTANLFTAANVLKKWVMAEEVIPQETILEPKLPFQIRTMPNLMH